MMVFHTVISPRQTFSQALFGLSSCLLELNPLRGGRYKGIESTVCVLIGNASFSLSQERHEAAKLELHSLPRVKEKAIGFHSNEG